ncbi:MAG: ABC transporter substrate-binding protein [Candidatus Limnocylindria bacterium]
MSRRHFTKVSALAFGLLLAACTTSPAGSPGASAGGSGNGATPESLTVLCTPQEDWCQAMVEAFEADTGIETSYVRLSSGEALARLRAASGDPEFSVWWGGPADGFVAANAEGLLEAYVSPNAEPVAADQKEAEGVWTGVYVGALGFCSNTAVLGDLGVDVPTSWEALLDPALEGQVAVAHPASSGTAYTAFYTQVARLGGEEEALDYMKELHPNVLQYTSSGAAPAEMAGRGEIAVSIVFSHDCVRNIDAGFADLEVSFPEEGTGYEIGGVSLIANAPEPEAAKMWIDWSLTAEAQEIGATVASFQLPTNPDAAVSERSVNLDEVNLVDYDFNAAGEARADLTARFEDEVAAKPAE